VTLGNVQGDAAVDCSSCGKWQTTPAACRLQRWPTEALCRGGLARTDSWQRQRRPRQCRLPTAVAAASKGISLDTGFDIHGSIATFLFH